ncbi:phosphoribosyltransferase [Actinoplanes sp. HUAS TT8]|uniref:phosphoribosyltransferase n=1 Tax=Actinoplanes sp. HUAS TT8 TaxID=3447453 RepID=UPI003F521EB7
MSERETLTWEAFGRVGRDLAQAIVDDGFRPDLILAVARGGLLAAGSISYALDVKNTQLINVEFYTGVDERLDLPVMLSPVPEVSALAGANILIVDDVADTGATLKLVHDFCAGPAAQVRTAVIYEKPHTSFTCNYVWARTDKWINFPWSSEPTVTASVRSA